MTTRLNLLGSDSIFDDPIEFTTIRFDYYGNNSKCDHIFESHTIALDSIWFFLSVLYTFTPLTGWCLEISMLVVLPALIHASVVTVATDIKTRARIICCDVYISRPAHRANLHPNPGLGLWLNVKKKNPKHYQLFFFNLLCIIVIMWHHLSLHYL